MLSGYSESMSSIEGRMLSSVALESMAPAQIILPIHSAASLAYASG
jgi:hypothetical protein